MAKMDRILLGCVLCGLLMTPLAAFAGGHGHGPQAGPVRYLGPPERPGSRSGLIQVPRNVFYPSENLMVRVTIPRSLSAVWSGDADAHVVVWACFQNSTASESTSGSCDMWLTSISLDTGDLTPDRPMTWAEIDLRETRIPVGEYQLGLVLTVPGGDPLDLADWYHGFSGLVSTTRIKFNTDPDPEDPDQDGVISGDLDGDGFPDW